MKELIMSIYDSGFTFTCGVVEDNVEIERLTGEKQLSKFGLWDQEWHWFAHELINKNNKLIQDFDKIIICEDGDLVIYRKGEHY